MAVPPSSDLIATVARQPSSPLPARHCAVLALAFACATASCAPKTTCAPEPGSKGEPPPYILSDTHVREIYAHELQRTYQLFVALPPSYARGDRRYPVLFITDANYAFPLARSVARRVGNGGKGLEDFILIGLSYARDETPEYSRRRDYTPTRGGDPDAVSDMPGRAPAYGGAEAYRRFLADEVLPVVEHAYRVDMNRKVYAGHSYGALFGLHILWTTPTMFERYILGSPSLWFDNRVMLSREQEIARTRRDLPANVLMAIGARENADPDMVSDLRDLERALRSRGYPSLHLTVKVIDDEDHLTVFPSILSRGLRWAFPPKG